MVVSKWDTFGKIALIKISSVGSVSSSDTLKHSVPIMKFWLVEVVRSGLVAESIV